MSQFYGRQSAGKFGRPNAGIMRARRDEKRMEAYGRQQAHNDRLVEAGREVKLDALEMLSPAQRMVVLAAEADTILAEAAQKVAEQAGEADDG